MNRNRKKGYKIGLLNLIMTVVVFKILTRGRRYLSILVSEQVHQLLVGDHSSISGSRRSRLGLAALAVMG